MPSDARLRPDQLRPLLSAIAREQREIFEERALGIAPGQVPDEAWHKRMQAQQRERIAATNQRILEASTSILSPRQLEHLRSMLQQELDAHSGRVIFFGHRAPLAVPPDTLQRQ